MQYSIKEIFYTLQGEGANTGTAAIFCRFSGCNLWNGRLKDKNKAICNFCDTDFNGTDGINGGRFENAESLVKVLIKFWPEKKANKFVVFTGGEPLLQLDASLIKAMKSLGAIKNLDHIQKTLREIYNELEQLHESRRIKESNDLN